MPHHRGMSILAEDPETLDDLNLNQHKIQADLQWSASQSGSKPGDLGSDEIRTADPPPYDTFFSSQPFPVSASGLISFTVISASPMPVCQMPTPRHGNIDSSTMSTSTRLLDPPGTDLT